jgi:beta-barrel assembly-enhancing protease
MLSEVPHGFHGRYADGHSAERVQAAVRLDPAGLAFQIPGAAETLWPFADLRAAEPIRNRSMDAVISSKASGQASLYLDDTQLLALIKGRAPHLTLGRERWRTARPGLAVGAAALSIWAGVWAFDLSPSKGLASTMPVKARAALGQRVIATLPRQGRCSNLEGRAALDKLVRRLMPQGPITAQNVTVLDWRLTNAFAVPGNSIVLTRGIIEQARSADEIAAVIGHEAGHSVELHPEASLVRSVGFWALVQMMFTGTPGAVGNIGTVLAQLGYTRSAERSADDHALRLLRDANISAKGMADFFRRMELEKPNAESKIPGASNDIFASHPSNAARVQMIEAQPAYPSTPALSEEDWQALKGICAPEGVKVTALPRSTDAEAADAMHKKRVADAKRAADAKAAADRAAAEAAIASAKRMAETRAADVKVPLPPGVTPPAPEIANTTQRTEGPTPAPVQVATNTAPAPVPVPAPALSPADVKIDAASKRILADATDAAAFMERGQAYAAKKSVTAAIEDFTRVIALQPTSTDARLWRASLYGQQKQLDLAVADYGDVIRLQPKSYAAYNNRGSLYRSQKKYDPAIKDFTSAIALDAKQPMALINRGLTHRDRSNLDAALADFNAAVAASPTYVTALARRGETLELKGSKDAALADYRAVLKLPEPAGGTSEPHKTARARVLALE